MLRDALTIAISPAPVPVPYETVPSYDTGRTRTRAVSNEEYSSSSIPPKFIGKFADSDILGNVDVHLAACKTKCRPFTALHKFRRGLREGCDDHGQGDRRVARNIRRSNVTSEFAEHRRMRRSVRRRPNIQRGKIGGDRDSVLVAARCRPGYVRRDLSYIQHVLPACAAERDNARVTRLLRDVVKLHGILRGIECYVDLFFKLRTSDADRKLGAGQVGAIDRNS